jgi:endonuclease V-like protein UPF0215 family
VLGIDDAPFAFGNEKVLVVGVAMRIPDYIEGVMRTECQVDGEDANQALAAMISGSRFMEQIKLVMIDGVALGGFNIVDIDALSKELGIPVATVTRDPPDLVKMESALRKYFSDWERRLEIVRRRRLVEVETGHKPLLMAVAGMNEKIAAELIKKSIVRGAVPEPIRVAHLIASAVVRGESRGPA